MIKDHIYEGAAVEAVGWPKDLFGFFGGGVLVGELVDGPVEGDTFLDIRGVGEFLFAFDEVADHIAHKDAGVGEGEVCVSEVVHFFSLPRMFYR